MRINAHIRELQRALLVGRRHRSAVVITLLVLVMMLIGGQMVHIYLEAGGTDEIGKGFSYYKEVLDPGEGVSEKEDREHEMIEHEKIRDKLFEKGDEAVKEEGEWKVAEAEDALSEGGEEKKEEQEAFGGGEESELSKFLEKVVRVVITAKPKTGFELEKAGAGAQGQGADAQEDGADAQKDGAHAATGVRYDNGYKLFPRRYGANGVVNVAVHDDPAPVLSEQYLSQCLELPDEVYDDLRASHFYVTQQLPQTHPAGMYKGDGIVMVGGGRYSWLVLLAVENLRRAGSQLPVEVFIPTEREYEPQLCESLLPRLNARCYVLPRRLPFIKKFANLFGGYQYKSLALLTSSFERVLLLDADNIAVANPDGLFASEPFQTRGMVLWPDYWRRVAHPAFYRLARFAVGARRVRNGQDNLSPPQLYASGMENPVSDIPLHDRQGTVPDLTTESGQILVNKDTHMRTLLLSLYYNLYGPHQYYPLLSQGSSGEGDKETFLTAATYYGEDVYNVKRICGSLGYWLRDSAEFIGVGMAQHDPVVDFRNTEHFREYTASRLKQFQESNPNWSKLMPQLLKSIEEDPENNFQATMNRNQRPLFFHCNFPKPDPVKLKADNLVVDKEGNERRIYLLDGEDGDDGFEETQWQIMHKYFCETPDFSLRYFSEAHVKPGDYCGFIEHRLEFLKTH